MAHGGHHAASLVDDPGGITEGLGVREVPHGTTGEGDC
jgi:hypothetical protein